MTPHVEGGILMQINKLLTKTNYENTNNTNRIKYLVVHYVGALGGAQDNCKYFYDTYRGASAHYFVGHQGEIWQCVDDADVAWHCGAPSYKHPSCRNSNSIGIELCCKNNGNWYFEDATVNAAVELTKYLMKKYNIPAANVIRHYDVVAKNCPAPYVDNNTKHTWVEFKTLITKPDVKYRVQVGAFDSRANAERLMAQVKAKGFSAFIAVEGGKYKVQVGAFANRSNADSLKAKVKAAGFDAFISAKE